MAHYEEALRINPDDAKAHYNLGIALGQAGRVQEATEQWEQALRINPDDAEAHYNLGVALSQAGRLPEAMKHWEQVLRLKPDDVDTHYNLGTALQRQGRVPEAIEQFEQALKSGRISLRRGTPSRGCGRVNKSDKLAPQGLAEGLQRARLRFQRLGDEVDTAGGGADVGFDDAVGGIDDGSSAVGVLQQLLHGAAKAVGVRDLDARALGDELAGDGAEVLHVGTEDDGMTAGGGLDDVLSPLPDEAFADEDHGGDLVEPLQFAGAVDDEAIVGFSGLFESRIDLGAEDEFDLFAFGEVDDFAGTLDVARDENEEQAGELRTQVGEQVEQDFLFAGMGAAGHEDGLRGRHIDLLEQLDGINRLRVGVGHGDVVLHVAGHVDAVRGHADGGEIGGVLVALRAHQRELAEHALRQPAQPFVAALGAGGHATVDQKERDAARRPRPDMVRPQFGFDEDDEVRLNQAVRTMDAPREILREIEQLDFLRQALVGLRVSRSKWSS